jgi:glycosyltransferase involved in cell wall biosynthesis
MKRILFLLRSFGIGGAERQLNLLASGLQQSGYSVKIAVFYEGGPLEEDARTKNIQIVDLNRKGRWDLIPFFFRLVALIKIEKPDILHSYLQVPNIWAAFIKLILPRTKVVWGVRASNVDMKQYNWQSQLTDYAEALLAHIPDYIICNSQAGMRHSIANGYPEKRMSVVPNGTDTTHFYPDRKLGLKIRTQWRIKPDQKLIGMIGRMDPMKDYPNFLRAASLLLRECENVRFVCVGGGSDKYVKQYHELACSLGLEQVLIWAGEQENMLSICNALDVLVLSSAHGEGFSNVIGEAMACGVPCVATDVGDAKQLIGSLGEVVPPRDSEALKQGVLAVLKRLELDEANLHSEVSRRIYEQFSASKLISRTIDVLNKTWMQS